MMSRFLVAVAILTLAGCAQEPAEEPAGQFITTANGPVEFEFPGDWHENEKEHPFDLQCLSRHERMNTGVFLFAKQDLAADLAPRELLERQVEDMRSKRQGFEVVEEEQVIRREGKTITTVVYSGEKGSLRDYYKFSLIEFAEHPDLLPIVLQVSVPSYWDENKPVLEAIVASARVVPSSPGEQR